MKKNICVVTGTRAEYYLLYPVLMKIKKDPNLNLMLVVTGTHLSNQYGNTHCDIERDGFNNYVAIHIIPDDWEKKKDSFLGWNAEICKVTGMAIDKFGDYFDKKKPDIVVLLGDRYEMLAVATAATICHIPIAHIHGGEITEGAMDDMFRHAITKMSYLHFTCCDEYRARVIQMGEAPERVFNVGALGVENIKTQELFSRKELEDNIGFCLGNQYAILTFHPVTLDNMTVEQQFNELMLALDEFKDIKIIFTKSNADQGGIKINKMIDDYVKKNSERMIAFHSLGMKRYLSAIKYANVVIGNSSSGIIETPYFKTPTVNIGDRQKGRIQAENIINCEIRSDAIIKAIKMALSDEFCKSIKNIINPYGCGDTSAQIVSCLKDFLNNDSKDLKKKFYDIKEG